MLQKQIHQAILNNCDAASDWFEKKSSKFAFPFYTSYDVRDSGHMIAPVDANIYPAGFNNICPADKEYAVEIVQKYLSTHYLLKNKKILLLTEEHTGNPYYWENVSSIQNMISSAGYEVELGIPKDFEGPITVKTINGTELRVHSIGKKDNQAITKNGIPDLIISNNDFSEAYSTWGEGLETPVNPPREFGWYRRKKHIFFSTYNQLAGEFSDLIGVDKSIMQLETELFEGVDFSDPDSIERLANAVDQFIEKLKAKYAQLNIPYKPFVFIKNNAGTYGLAVIQAASGDDVRNWNSKSRKKMKAAKGGRDVTEVIIQEGIPTRLKDEGATAEPCIYMVGCQLVGGFLRTHAEKGPEESLNSPGAVYKKLCMADLEIKQSECPKENVYGWISRLGVLSTAVEAEKLGVFYKNYKSPGCPE